MENEASAAIAAEPEGLTDAPRWDERSATGTLTGHVFTYGSLLFGEDPEAARAGYGLAVTKAVGVIQAIVYGAYLGLIQCIDAAEVFVATVALRLAIPLGLLTMYTDSAFLADGWAKGRVWCTAARRTHADVWVQFWDALEDSAVSELKVVKVKGHATEEDVA